MRLRFGADRLEVENDGAALPADVLAQLGQRFHRVDGQAESGSGLGVSIVQRIAALHGLSLRYRARADGQGVVAELVRANEAALVFVGTPRWPPCRTRPASRWIGRVLWEVVAEVVDHSVDDHPAVPADAGVPAYVRQRVDRAGRRRAVARLLARRPAASKTRKR